MEKDKYICSPLNYMGGKYKLLSQILPLFPKNINVFLDLFCGGCNVGINTKAKKVIFNDNLCFLIDLYLKFQETSKQDILKHIDAQIENYKLSIDNTEGFATLKKEYNTHKDPLDLFLLAAYSFNHQIRFNNNFQFNTPFGKNRSSFNSRMKKNLIAFLDKIQNDHFVFKCKNFVDFDLSFLGKDDFLYCDPPYLITTGTYNDGKRGFEGWKEKQEYALLGVLEKINKKEIRFALSNVLIHKGKENLILQKWIKKNHFNVFPLSKNYSNSNYQTKDREKGSTLEVLITNYTL